MPGPYNTHTTGDEIVQDHKEEIRGKVILTTGVSPGGLGAVFVERVAAGAQPKLLILASRNVLKMKATADAISKLNSSVKTRTLQIDFESFKSVREAATTVNGWSDVPSIDILMNNAGIMAVDYAKTEDGIERHFKSNHLGPFLFTNLIIDKILASDSPRIINVSSSGHRLSAIRWADIGFSEGKLYNRWRAYGQTKTANILTAVALAEKLGNKGLTAVSLHPGTVGTNLDSHFDWKDEYAGLKEVDETLGNKEAFQEGFPWKNLERGVATHIYAAFDPSLKGMHPLRLPEHNGAYLEDSHIADPYVDTAKPHARDRVEADRLWKLSEELVGQKFDY